MNAKLLGLFSGFPSRHFTDEIAEILKEELKIRDSLVFISCQPDNYTQNDEDSHGMHNMFVEKNMSFTKYNVIDYRTNTSDAIKSIREASCIFLMGGNATLQFKLICDMGILHEIRQSNAAILGVSAGAMNIGGPTVDIYESSTPYEGLALAHITTKAHYPFDNDLLQSLKEVSMKIPICLMTDESAIFITKEKITQTGQIYWMVKENISSITQDKLEQIRK